MDKTLELLMDIRKRPEIYIGRKSLELLYTYLLGYYHYKGHTESDCLTGFQDYIDTLYGLRVDHNWAILIRFFCSSDEEAFIEFYSLFDKYLLRDKRK
jgi:hypothetical protein